MTRTRVKGSGLGLYFADRLMRAMGGSVRIESPIWPDPDAPGARFSIRVAVAEDVPDDDPDHLEPIGVGGRLMSHVLVIDDDRSLLELLSDYLRRQGFGVATAPSGQAGLAEFSEHEPDLVLLDVTMHGLDGWQVLAQLRERSNVPIIMLTARSEEPEVLRGFSAGVDDYVSKPFSFAQLVARMGAVLDRGRVAPARTRPRYSRGADLEVDVDRHRVYRQGEVIDLTATEFRILTALLREQGRVLSVRELVTEVWGADYADETGYVRRYVWHLRRKLEPDPRRPRYILNERGIGYVFPADA